MTQYKADLIRLEPETMRKNAGLYSRFEIKSYVYVSPPVSRVTTEEKIIFHLLLSTNLTVSMSWCDQLVSMLKILSLRLISGVNLRAIPILLSFLQTRRP